MRSLRIAQRLSRKWFQKQKTPGSLDIDCSFSQRSRMCLYGTRYNYSYCIPRRVVSAGERRSMRGELDQLSCELKRCRYAMQKRENEVSKRELGRYALKLQKPRRLGSSGSVRSRRLCLVKTLQLIQIRIKRPLHCPCRCRTATMH